MPWYAERSDGITKTLWQSVCSKYKSFLINMRKNQLGGWIKFTKNTCSHYLWSAVYQHKKSHWVGYLLAADVHYHLDCWLAQACWSGAILTTITTILVCCKCKRQHRWFDIAITNMNAGPVQVYDTCMLVGIRLQKWLLVRCNCWRHGKW